MPNEPLATARGFDARMAGRRAECDGGGPVGPAGYATRQQFSGVLTGDYVDHGDPPWRWYLMGELSRKPAGYAWGSVWCEQGNIFLIDD